MPDELVYSEDVDKRLNWPLGTAGKLARRRKLPHYVLPDGSIRFCLSEVESLVRRVPVPQPAAEEEGRS